MTEKFTIDQCFSKGGTVHPDQGSVFPLTAIMDGLGDKFLPGTTFPGNKNRCICFRHIPDLFKEPVHFGIPSNDVFKTVALPAFRTWIFGSLEDLPVAVAYYRYEVRQGSTSDCTHEGQPIEDSREVRPGIHRVGPVSTLDLHNDIARLGFKKLFIEGWTVAKTVHFLATHSFAGARKRERIEETVQQMSDYGKRNYEVLDPEFDAYA